ncbi:shikimate kinase [Polymorphum gilvum]|uniref:Shikimate kinase n=1 Tax=Polymorphum gilvum (strain LMG 25793 / CGMCC 1.9160 / SL003B-26A1) TaxID=991905 RepID=F2J223_POLGS|nr:shikimate kinase [Polymorphum gilvum]ADZ68782.1 Shikimate kinase, 3-dehydroquinate synthase [Polymorphum gilvum SL003B-26A1]
MNSAAPDTQERDKRAARLVEALGTRSIVLVGIMGCGKSSVGRRLAQRLAIPFVDADAEIETAANMTVSEIFAVHGETEFRRGEEKVIARLLRNGPQVLATGGGAYMSDATRAAIARRGVSVWLRADLDTVMTRVRKRPTRPLLQTPDPEATMRELLARREPVYGLADIAVWSRDVPHEMVMEDIIAALEARLCAETRRQKEQTSDGTAS